MLLLELSTHRVKKLPQSAGLFTLLLCRFDLLDGLLHLSSLGQATAPNHEFRDVKGGRCRFPLGLTTIGGGVKGSRSSPKIPSPLKGGDVGTKK